MFIFSDPFLSANVIAEAATLTTALSEKDDCSCGISAILESRSQSRTGMVNTQMIQSGHALQASVNITPHSALPTRHSKSLDQLKVGNFATMPCRTIHHDDRKKKREMSSQDANLNQNGCNNYYHSTLPVRHQNGPGRKFPYTSRSSVDLAYRKEPHTSTLLRDNQNWETKQNRKYEYQSQPPRPLSEPQSKSASHPRHSCRPSDEVERYIVCAPAKNATITSSSSVKCINNSTCTHFPRSNSTQIFPPNRNELDIMFHRSTLILSRNKEQVVIPNCKLDPDKRILNYRRASNVSCRKDYQISNIENTGLVNTLPKYNQSNRVSKCSKEDYKNSSISRYKLSREITVNSSSTDSESINNSNSKRLQTSASVPHHLAHSGDRLRHVRSASSVLDELYPLAATASESLPNLIRGAGAGAGNNLLSLSTSASTSSLTSEQSGWVSSRNSSEISSPEIPPSTTNDEMLAINGEQLRNKLYELITDQTKDCAQSSKQHQNPLDNELVHFSRNNTNVINIRMRKTDKTNLKKELIDDKNVYNFSNKKMIENSDMIQKDIHKNNGVIQKTSVEHPYIKKEFTQILPVENQKEVGGYEELRLPPPKQFRDVPLPPEPFRDPSPGPSPAIDNLLYHVYETIQDDIKKSKSNTDLADKIEGKNYKP